MDQGLTVEDLRACNNYALREACAHGHVPIVEYLIAQGLTVADFRSHENEALRWESTSILVLRIRLSARRRAAYGQKMFYETGTHT